MQKWVTIKAAKSGGKEIKVGTKGEGEIPLHLIGKVAILPEVLADEDDADSGSGLTKPQIVAKLKELGIEHNPADKKAVLEALLPA